MNVKSSEIIDKKEDGENTNNNKYRRFQTYAQTLVQSDEVNNLDESQQDVKEDTMSDEEYFQELVE